MVVVVMMDPLNLNQLRFVDDRNSGRKYSVCDVNCGLFDSEGVEVWSEAERDQAKFQLRRDTSRLFQQSTLFFPELNY